MYRAAMKKTPSGLPANLDAFHWRMLALTRPQKITFGEMRSSGVRGLLIYCADYHCSHSMEINADRWPDHIRLSDLEPLFTCQACSQRGADIRPDFNWAKQPKARRALSALACCEPL
jgi:hypothetical protein